MESELQNPAFHIVVDEIVLDKERFTMADLNELESQAEQYRAEGKVKEEPGHGGKEKGAAVGLRRRAQRGERRASHTRVHRVSILRVGTSIK